MVVQMGSDCFLILVTTHDNIKSHPLPEKPDLYVFHKRTSSIEDPDQELPVHRTPSVIRITNPRT